VNSPFNTLLREQHLGQAVTVFVSTFSTLLATINPLKVLPVFLKLLEGEDAAEQADIFASVRRTHE
jgi:small neutral amino acid transporter SnatA (MarC family)